jgi:hypothetical protein
VIRKAHETWPKAEQILMAMAEDEVAEQRLTGVNWHVVARVRAIPAAEVLQALRLLPLGQVTRREKALGEATREQRTVALRDERDWYEFAR